MPTENTSEVAVQRVEQPDVLTQIEMRIATVSPDMPLDEMLAICEAARSVKERITKIVKDADAAQLEWHKENGTVEMGEKVMGAGHDKKVECVDQQKAFEAIMDAAAGDCEAIAKTFAAGAFKPGACKTLLGDKFKEYFKTVWSDKLVLKRADKRFLKSPGKDIDSDDEA